MMKNKCLSNKRSSQLLLVCCILSLFTLSLIKPSFAQDDSLAGSYLKIDSFSFVEANLSDLGDPVLLWATNYRLPEYVDGSGDVPLRDAAGNELGPKIPLGEWCKSALEGSVRIVFKDGSAKTYNYDKTTDDFPNDCSKFYSFKLGKTKFRVAHGSFGDGIGDFRLAPYRTLATDPKLIPTGTVIYIPEARGAKIILPTGESVLHDGYFFAGDIGGAIKSNHVDVFIGSNEDSPFFPWITNTSKKPFKAYIVKDQDIITSLTELHLK